MVEAPSLPLVLSVLRAVIAGILSYGKLHRPTAPESNDNERVYQPRPRGLSLSR